MQDFMFLVFNLYDLSCLDKENLNCHADSFESIIEFL
jgi:hypothetical protein